MKSMRAWLLFAGLVLVPSVTFAARDEFDDDPLTNPEWELYQPASGGTFLTEDGHLRFIFPTNTLLDHWSTVDGAVQLRRTDMPEDFTIETRVFFQGSGDPLAPTWPPVAENYQCALMVQFAPLDCFYFGFYRGTALWLERSGFNQLCVLDPALQEASLQIKKGGATYTFSYRPTDDDEWIPICSRDTAEAVTHVGYIFKTWGLNTSEETFDFDYFSMEETPGEPPVVETPCPIVTPDVVWMDMPYLRPVNVTGIPTPEVAVAEGPEGLAYDVAGRLLSGWTPDAFGAVPIRVEASSPEGTGVLNLGATVEAASSLHDDEFDEDPALDTGYWELYQPQLGVGYSTSVTESGNSWRMDVPNVGDQGLNWDTWVGVDRAPQLRHAIDGTEDFTIETKLRVAPDAPPGLAEAWLAGLMVNFNGGYDLIHYNIGGERTAPNGLSNIFAERSGLNNLANSYAAGIINGQPIGLRIEKKCDLYSYFFRATEAGPWQLTGTYRTADPPMYVGLIMKTWGGVTPFGIEFEYFDILTPGPRAIFTASPLEGTEPLQVSFDASGSSSPNGAITAWAWDFGDGDTATGATANHTYATNGSYLATLTVTDATGDKGSRSVAIKALFRSGDVSPWTPEDVGDPAPAVAGGARAEGGDCITLKSYGLDLVSRADQFFLLSQQFQGDCSIVAKLSASDWAMGSKLGVMLREDLTPGSRHFSMYFVSLATGNKFQCVRRETADAAAGFPKTSTVTFTIPDGWVRVQRLGTTVTGSFSTDGAAWTELVAWTTSTLPDSLLGGLFASSGAIAGAAGVQATFCEIETTGTVGPATETDCDDEIDNDGDLATDCADSDCASAPNCQTTGTPFHRGDSNADGSINITDGIYILNYLFLGGPTPTCLEASNPNDDAQINITDGIYVLNFLFLGGPSPANPGPVDSPCGVDPVGSPTDLGCVEYTKC